MPQSATITTFHTFVANTKARSSQVNTNFSNFRGHNVPIEPLTATASDMTYDVGASDHRWRAGYFGSLDLQSSTTTAGVILKGSTVLTLGAFLFQIGGTTVAQVLSSGFDGSYLKLLSVDTPSLANNAVTTAKITDANVTRAKIEALNYTQDGNTDTTITSTSFVSTNLAINFTNTRPIKIEVLPDPSTCLLNGGTGGMQVAVDRAASNIAFSNVAPGVQTTTPFIFFYAGTGNATYTIVARSIDGTAVTISNWKMTIYELD